MLRNANPISEFSKSSFLPINFIQDNAWDSRKTSPLVADGASESKPRSVAADDQRAVRVQPRPPLKTLTQCMPLLDSGTVAEPQETPTSPEMPTLLPFVFDQALKADPRPHCLALLNGGDPPTRHPTRLSDDAADTEWPGGRSGLDATADSRDKRFQPVVVLRRLPDSRISTPEPSEEDEASGDSWVQWPEEYEGCSYDDYLDPGQVVEKLPEVDVIDGVEFLSFLQEGDVKDYARNTPQNLVYPSECSSLNDFDPPTDDHLSKDEHPFIVPTKTRDITQIKGWKRKLFLDENYASTDSLSPLFRDDRSQEPAYSPVARNLEACEDRKFSASLRPESPPTVKNVLLLGEQPLPKDSAKKAAFASSNLDDFLNKHSQLTVNYLSECIPTVTFIPDNHPVLSVGTLKVEEKEPSQKRARTVAQVYPRHRTHKKREETVPKFTHSPRYNPGIKRNQIDKEQAKAPSKSPTVIEKAQVKKDAKEAKPEECNKRNILFMDDSSNSIIDVVSYDLDINRLQYDSLECEREYNEDYSLPYDTDYSFRGKLLKDDENFAIEEYEPMTFDEETLLASVNKPPTIITETIWSTEDTSREERKLYDLLCMLKSPDSYLISKIKFHDDSLSDDNEPLTEDDALEVAKCVYGGFASVRELVDDGKRKEALDRLAQRKKRKRVRKRADNLGMKDKVKDWEKAAAYVKAVQNFAEWRRTQCDGVSPPPPRRRRASLDARRDPPRKRSIRMPARFLDSSFENAPEDWESIESSQNNDLDVSTGPSKPPSPSSALTFECEDVSPPSPVPSRSTTPNRAPNRPITPGSSSEFSGFASLSSRRSSPVPFGPPSPDPTPSATPSYSPPHLPDATEARPTLKGPEQLNGPVKTDSDVGSKTHSEVRDPRRVPRMLFRKDTTVPTTKYSISSNSISSLKSSSDILSQSSKPDDESGKEVNPSTKVSKHADADSVPRTSSRRESSEARAEPVLVGRETPSDPMVLNITAPPGPNNSLLKKSLAAPNNGLRQDRLSVELGSGIHTITTTTSRNAEEIQRIKMNLKSMVNIDKRVQMALQRHIPAESPSSRKLVPLIHLIPLNEYQWKPPNSHMTTSPTIKSFVINSASRKEAVLPDGHVNLPLAAVAQPISSPTSEEIFLLYGTIEMLPDPRLLAYSGPKLNSRASASGLVIRIGKQEFFVSCAAELAKAPVRLNAVIANVMKPLLLYPVLSNGAAPSKADGSASNTRGALVSVSEKGEPAFKEATKSSLATNQLQPEHGTHGSNATSRHYRISVKDQGISVEEDGETASITRGPFSFPKKIEPRPVNCSALKQPIKPQLTGPGSPPRKFRFAMPVNHVPGAIMPNVQSAVIFRNVQKPPNSQLAPDQAGAPVPGPAKSSPAPAPTVQQPLRLGPSNAVKQAPASLGVSERTTLIPKTSKLGQVLYTMVGNKNSTGYELHIVNDSRKEASGTSLQDLLSDEVDVQVRSSLRKTAFQAQPADSEKGVVPAQSQHLGHSPETQLEAEAVPPDQWTAAAGPEQQEKSQELDFGITDVRSCPSEVFGVPAAPLQALAVHPVSILATPRPPLVQRLVPSRLHRTRAAPLKTISPKTVPRPPADSGQALAGLRKPFAPQTSQLLAHLQARTPPQTKVITLLPPGADAVTTSPEVFTAVASAASSPPAATDPTLPPDPPERREEEESDRSPSTEPCVIDLDSEEDSVWISGEGETCFVMRLPDEEEELSDEPSVVVCT